ncbi:Protein MAINTENANCE OF MERISTEMS [Glycine max]|nr:Protein MAINTENANCE OF MERISTEMS [Glycine max]
MTHCAPQSLFFLCAAIFLLPLRVRATSSPSICAACSASARAACSRSLLLLPLLLVLLLRGCCSSSSWFLLLLRCLFHSRLRTRGVGRALGRGIGKPWEERGGPHDTLVLRYFENHIALRVWNGEERPEVKLSSHGRKMAKFGRPAPEIEGLVAASELSPLIAWAFHSFKQLHVDDVVDMLVELLESGTYAWGAAALVYMYDNLNEASKSTVRQLAGYITLLKCWIYEHFSSIGSALATEDYDERRLCACQWTLGKALPVSMYHRCLDRLTHDVVCWIPYGDHHSLREFEVISLFFGHLRWGPLTVIHRSKRVLRQFAYIQTIPPHPTAPSVSIEEMDDRWM